MTQARADEPSMAVEDEPDVDGGRRGRGDGQNAAGTGYGRAGQHGGEGQDRGLACGL